MPMEQPHRRQFIAGPRPVQVYPTWRTSALDSAGTVHVSWCPDLPVVEQLRDNGARWVLLGDAIPLDPTDASPSEVLRAASSAGDVLRASRRWFGRWLLLLDGTVHMDAVGMLSCHHR